jgi:hypothetical protein
MVKAKQGANTSDRIKIGTNLFTMNINHGLASRRMILVNALLIGKRILGEERLIIRRRKRCLTVRRILDRGFRRGIFCRALGFFLDR